MNAELAAPDRRYGKLPSSESKPARLESAIISLVKSNSIPLISFRYAAFRRARSQLASEKHGKIQGNPICVADPSPTGGDVLSAFQQLPPSDCTSNIMNGLSQGGSTCFSGISADEKKHPLHYQPKECRFGRFAASWPRTSLVLRHIGGDVYNDATLGTSILNDYCIGNLPT
jgi:hypothetical protein